jgi:uncharacterized membrane protein
MAQTGPMHETAGNRLVFEDSAEIQAPVSEVYRRWTDFTHFPEFMSNVQEVRALNNDRYHWVARIFGMKQEWDAEVTEQEPQHHVSWRSVTGPYNSGTVSFSPLPNGNTEVRLRLEYSPPGGQAGKVLERMAQVTRREVREDLENFRRVVMGEKDVTGAPETSGGFGGVLGALGGPVSAGLAGGLAAYLIERSLRTRRPLAPVVGPVDPAAAIAGWTLAGASLASVAASATLRARGDRTNALFVGQWAPTFLGASILARLVGHRNLQASEAASVASWTLTAASAGSIIASIVLHLTGQRGDGLFVGQWAPTFLGGALLARLFGR